MEIFDDILYLKIIDMEVASSLFYKVCNAKNVGKFRNNLVENSY